VHEFTVRSFDPISYRFFNALAALADWPLTLYLSAFVAMSAASRNISGNRQAKRSKQTRSKPAPAH
jgi:hypothetical protein